MVVVVVMQIYMTVAWWLFNGGHRWMLWLFCTFSLLLFVKPDFVTIIDLSVLRFLWRWNAVFWNDKGNPRNDSNITLVHWNKIFTTIFMRANSLCINYKQIWSMYITLYTQTTTTHTHTHRTGYTRMHITRRMIKKSNLLYEFAFVCGSCETLAYEPMKALMCLHLFSCVRFGSVLMVVSSFFFVLVFFYFLVNENTFYE